MRKFAIILLLTLTVFANGQIKYFIEASGNVSLISKSVATQTVDVTSDKPDFFKFNKNDYSATYKNKPGGGITAGLQYFFQEDKISLDAGIDINNVNFFQKLKTESYYVYQSSVDYSVTKADNPPPSKTEKEDDHNLLLLSLPLSFSYYFLENNLSVSVGVLPGLLVMSTGGTGASADFNKTAMGIQVQLRYQFAPKIWVMGGFQEYSSKLYNPLLKQSFSNLRLIKLGLKYDI